MPVWIYIVGAILLFIALLLSIKVNIIISYNEEVNVFLRILFVRIKLYPQKIKIKKQKKSSANDDVKRTETEIQQKSDKGSSIVKVIWEIREIILSLISKCFGGLHFKFARLNIVVACEDAAKTALAYGVTVQTVAYLIETLDSISNVEISRRSDINISSNFISQKSSIDGKITLYIRVFSALKILIALLKTYFIFKSKKEITEDKNGKNNTK